ncbi:MAG: SRPBCC family protein [Thiobacillaceae bacterium]
MEVTLDKRYPLDVNIDKAWAVLRDLRSLASCMPGAAITEEIDPQHYKGTVKVKVGPATAMFNGDVEVLGIDEAAHQIRLLGKGADKGGSTAAMDLTTTIEAAGPGESVLVGKAQVTVNGKFAQFGGRMMSQVSDQVLDQFADNFKANAAAKPGAAPEPAKELNALLIVWNMIKAWIARIYYDLFGGRT